MNPFEKLKAARTDADVLAALAEGIAEEKGIAPAEAPTPEALAEWWPGCPDAERNEATERLRKLARLIPEPPDWPTENPRPPKPERSKIPDMDGWKQLIAARHAYRTWRPRRPPEADGWARWEVADYGGGPELCAVLPLPVVAKATGAHYWSPAPVPIVSLSRLWLEAHEAHPDNRPPYPLAPIVRAWIERPEDETAVSRPDPILARIEISESPERLAGKLAFGIAGREVSGDPGQLPLIEAPDALRVPLLELCDWHGVPVTQRGGGAPHALAVYVSAMLVTPLKYGHGERSIIATVRDLKEHLFPGRWNPSRDWPRVRQALIVADSLVIPEVYRTPSGFRQPWRAVALRTCPGEAWERGMLDAEIRLAVEHPPNASGDGPILERAELARLRASDGPKYRAYIGGHSLLWRPGATRVKHRGRWYWSKNTERYPILTAADRDRIAFASEGERRKHSRAVKDAAWEGLSGIRILDRTADTPDGRRGWRIAPEGAGPE